jgi:hypothetical protein
MVPTGTGRRSLGILLEQFGNHSFNAFHLVMHSKIYLPEHNSHKWSPHFRFLRLKVFFNEFLKFVLRATFPLISLCLMYCLNTNRDCQVHNECGVVLWANQNAGIFDDWKSQITSFNGTERRYVFF